MAKPASSKSDYTARWATPNDFGKIVHFYKPSYIDEVTRSVRYRPGTVFSRTNDAYGAAMHDQRVLLIEDSKDNVKVAGILHLLNASAEIGKTADDSAVDMIDFNIAEIGSVYRQGDEPSGFCLELIYDLLILQTAKKAKECMINMLITQIVANNKKGINQLLKLNQGWDEFFITASYKTAFLRTLSDDGDKDTPLTAYRASPNRTLIEAAHSLLGITDTETQTFKPGVKPGIIEAYDHKSDRVVTINAAPTGMMDVANRIAARRSIIANARNGAASWGALNEVIFGAVPSPGTGQDSLSGVTRPAHDTLYPMQYGAGSPHHN